MSITIFFLQVLLTIGLAISPVNSQATWLVIDTMLVGVNSFFLAIFPFTIGLQIKFMSHLSNPELTSFFRKISFVMAVWTIGRLARVFDVFSSVPVWATWSTQFALTNWYWLYIAALYLVMEIIPQATMLLSSVSSLVDNMENPKNLKVLDRKRALAVLKQRVKDYLVATEEWDQEGGLLGKGIYSNVYSGVLRNERVAIKFFIKVLQREVEPLESFCREIVVLSTLDHPNVVKLKGVHVALDDHIYMFMELAQRGSLSTVLQRDSANISSEQKIKWALEIANGMVNTTLTNINIRK
jgi:hypothetical protein